MEKFKNESGFSPRQLSGAGLSQAAATDRAKDMVRRLWPNHEWKPVPGFENSYLASDGGLIWSIVAGTLCQYYSDKKGGHLAKLTRNGVPKWIMVAEVIAGCFVPNTDLINTHVVHINEMRTDNRASNLRWASRRELTKEILLVTAKHQRQPRLKHPSQLSYEDIQTVHEGNAAGASAYALACMLGVSVSSIYYHLRRGRSRE